MGGRGSFLKIDSNEFVFKDNGQTFFTIGEIDNIRILERYGYSVKAPEISHTENRIYAIIQNGNLKHLSFYDKNHNQIRSIDFGHKHGWNNLQPHVHFNLDHIKNEPGTPPSYEDLKIAETVKKWLKVNYNKNK